MFERDLRLAWAERLYYQPSPHHSFCPRCRDPYGSNSCFCSAKLLINRSAPFQGFCRLQCKGLREQALRPVGASEVKYRKYLPLCEDEGAKGFGSSVRLALRFERHLAGWVGPLSCRLPPGPSRSGARGWAQKKRNPTLCEGGHLHDRRGRQQRLLAHAELTYGDGGSQCWEPSCPTMFELKCREYLPPPGSSEL
jgi:hypothetical protein